MSRRFKRTDLNTSGFIDEDTVEEEEEVVEEVKVKEEVVEEVVVSKPVVAGQFQAKHDKLVAQKLKLPNRAIY